MVKQTTFWRCMQVDACDNDTDGELDGVHVCVIDACTACNKQLYRWSGS